MPIFRIRPGTKQPFHGSRGFYDATSDEGQIDEWWRQSPSANLALRTGQASGILVLDEDRPGAFEELEREIGPLPETWTVRTPGGGRHRYYRLPESEAIPCSAGDGLDVRADGGYAVVPPSSTPEGEYRVLERKPMEEAPPKLLEWTRSRRLPPARASRPRNRENRRPRAEREPINEGVRNVTLFAFGLYLKDRGLPDEQVLDELLTINEERCEPPLDPGEVEKVARSACRPQYRRKKKLPPEALAIIEALEKAWWGSAWRRVGGKTEASMVRALLMLAKRHGELIPAGVRVSVSVRDLALILGCNKGTISEATKRLRQKGWVRKDANSRRGQSGAFVLLARHTPYTQDTACREGVESVRTLSRLGVAELTTRHYRWRGLVGKGKERALCALEAFGPQTAEELAERLGWSRARDLRHRYLEPLEELGLVAVDDAGVYSLPEGYEAAQNRVQEIPYAVREGAPLASERERERLDRERYERQREAFWTLRVSEELPPEVEADGEIRELEKLDEIIRDQREVFQMARSYFGRVPA